MHLDAERIERALHGELGPEQEAEVRAHLGECRLCERRLAQARREEEEVLSLLARLDHPPPAIGADAVVERARGRGRWTARAAAAVAAILVSGALFAAPGSPLRDALRQAAEWLAPAAPPASDPPGEGFASGVAVVPETDFAVVFAAPQERGVATVRLVDSPELSVRALGEPVSFALEIDRIAVANAGATADYQILLPRGAASVRVQLGATILLRATRGTVVSAALPDSLGRYRLPLR